MPSGLHRLLWVGEVFRPHVFEPGAHVLGLVQGALRLGTRLIPYGEVGTFPSRFGDRISHIDGCLKLQR